MDELKAVYHYEIARSSNLFQDRSGEKTRGYMKMEVGIKAAFTEEENELMHKDIAREMVAAQLKIDKQLIFPITEEMFNRMQPSLKEEGKAEYESYEEFEKEVMKKDGSN